MTASNHGWLSEVSLRHGESGYEKTGRSDPGTHASNVDLYSLLHVMWRVAKVITNSVKS